MTVIENENADPVGVAPRDPRKLFTDLAVKSGLLHEGEPISDALMDLCHGVVAICASIGDAYGDPEAGGCAGEHIRAELWEH